MSRDAEYKNIYRTADTLFIDGMSVAWLLHYKYRIHPERINGTNLVASLLPLCVRKEFKIFFLGSSVNVQQKLKLMLTRTYPALHFDLYAPPVRHDFTEKDKRIIFQRIRFFRPDILLVGFGAPKQERFLYQAKRILKVPVRIAVGGAFDYLAGVRPRAPSWMQQHGLEWFYRIVHEPRRLIPRYLKYDAGFIFSLALGDLRLL
ncbi:WecB/TagA/CpsF family glycosyltransferase [Patescibacteria group bacterium]|nr:WecB/TagA/CpsF family glycosyltransferase [Patescibacteria group bacterium]